VRESTPLAAGEVDHKFYVAGTELIKDEEFVLVKIEKP